MLHAEETGLRFVRVGFLACGFNSKDNNNNNDNSNNNNNNNNDNNNNNNDNNNNNNNNNNNIHLHSALLLVIQSALQSVLIVINLIKYYNDIFVKNK